MARVGEAAPAISSHPAETDPYEGSRQQKIRLDHSTGLVFVSIFLLFMLFLFDCVD